MMKCSSSLILALLLLNSLTPILSRTIIVNADTGPTPFETSVPVRGTYLFADNEVDVWDDNGDGVKEQHSLEMPLILNLGDAGLKPGDLVFISCRGEVHISANASWSWIAEDLSMLGVFSSTLSSQIPKSLSG